MQEKGLSSTTIGLMIGTALFFDLLQFVLAFVYMDWLFGIFAAFTFWLWFYMKGVKIGFSNPKRLGGFAATGLAEMMPIPFVAAFPVWTAFVITTAFKNKITEVGEGITKLDLGKK